MEVFFHGRRWVGEAKARQRLSVQKVLAATRRKASGSPAFLVWKCLVPVPGKLARQPIDGERVVVTLSWDDFLTLIEDSYNAGRNDTDNKESQ